MFLRRQAGDINKRATGNVRGNVQCKQRMTGCDAFRRVSDRCGLRHISRGSAGLGQAIWVASTARRSVTGAQGQALRPSGGRREKTPKVKEALGVFRGQLPISDESPLYTIQSLVHPSFRA